MFRGIQHAYYLEARNPSDRETLVELADAVGNEAVVTSGLRKDTLVAVPQDAFILAGPENEFCLATGLKRNPTEAIVNRYLTEMRGHMEGTGLVFPPLAAFEAIGCDLADSSKEILSSLQRS